MTTYERAAREVIQFLEELSSISPDLPDSIVGYWKEVLNICKEAGPNWDEAKTFCNQILTILNRLRGNDTDFRQVDRAQGKNSILLGAIHLSQREWQDAAYFFEQGARRLRYWDDTLFASLAYFGKALTFKEEAKWSEALEVAQKALDTIHMLVAPSKSNYANRLKERIEQEIDLITEDSIKDAKKKPPTPKAKLIKPKPPKPIPIVSDIAAGIGVITLDKTKDYLLLDEDYHNGADFAVEVIGDSMKGNGILSGDIALIHQQSTVNSGEIAAMIIKTPTATLGVLKQFYRYDKRNGMEHWLLRSSNPASEHLVVMPSGVNEELILDLYVKEVQSGKMRNPPKYYEEAELIIAGKYIGLVRKV